MRVAVLFVLVAGGVGFAVWRAKRLDPPPPAPSLPPVGIDTNEVVAIATLRKLVTAQAHFQATALADEDRDGEGEYGDFARLSALDLFVHRPEMGYRYRIDLPQGADLRERVWSCYAWPAERGVTGNRIFFVNQMGDILATEEAEGEPAPGAAERGGWTFVR